LEVEIKCPLTLDFPNQNLFTDGDLMIPHTNCEGQANYLLASQQSM
jgi:hypothetical protein